MKSWKFSVCDDFFNNPDRKNADDLGAVEICAHGGEYGHDFYIWLDFATPGLDYDIYAANSTVTDGEAEELGKAISQELGYFFTRAGYEVYYKEGSGLFNGAEGASWSPLSPEEQQNMENVVFAFFDGNEYTPDNIGSGLGLLGLFSYVLDEGNNSVNYEAVVGMMDDDLREELHQELAPCSQQYFFEEYAKQHYKKFGNDFTPWVGGQW